MGGLKVQSPGAEKDLNESFLGVPLYLNGKPWGAVSVQSYKQHAYGENDLRLLNTLVSSMSVALENARLLDETQRLLKQTEAARGGARRDQQHPGGDGGGVELPGDHRPGRRQAARGIPAR